MSTSFDLTEVDRFVAGAVGVPGARTFYLQVTAGATVLTFKCEKAHVEALARALSTLLGDLPPVTTGPSAEGSLAAPVLPEWAVGSIALGYEAPNDRIMVVLEDFGITRQQAKRFADAGVDLIRAGRPTCPVCATPVDLLGYSCTCFN
jgi:uncharacterized repeat protein (TIGR03847 family)